MSKYLVLCLIAGVSMKKGTIRPLYPAISNKPTPIVKSSERSSKSPIVHQCAHANV